MNQFMRRRNQIKFFVRFKADRSLKCLQYDPYVYHVIYQWNMRVSFDLLLVSLLITGALKRQRE